MSASGVVQSSSEAMLLLNPDDAMDVSVMVRFLITVGKIGKTPFESFRQAFREQPGRRDAYKEMKVYSEVVGNLAALIVGHHSTLEQEGNHMSVTEYLQTASKLGFLLFFLYRRNRSNFFPNQHYRNIQDTIKGFYLSVALAKHHNIEY